MTYLSIDDKFLFDEVDCDTRQYVCSEQMQPAQSASLGYIGHAPTIKGTNIFRVTVDAEYTGITITYKHHHRNHVDNLPIQR